MDARRAFHSVEFGSPQLARTEVTRSPQPQRAQLGLNMFHGKYDTDTNAPSTSSYQEYPPDMPFIHTDYRRNPREQINSLPVNNRDAVMNALKGLQDKIRQLEIERGQAEDNLKNIANETSNYRENMKRGKVDPLNVSGNLSFPGNLTQQNEDIKAKLDTAEGRCSVLEKQLEYMRKMVQNAEQDRSRAVRQNALLQQKHAEIHNDGFHSHLQKVDDLEREHVKLTATQTVAENKIRELEHKLREEKLQRRRMQERAAEMATAAESQRILNQAGKPGKKLKKKPKKHGLKGARSAANSSKYSKRSGMEPAEHYRLNLGGIPFTAGQSTTPSHSIAANFQEVLSLMKSHNNKLCKSPRQHGRNGHKFLPQTKSSTASSGIGTGSSVYSTTSQHELNEILLQLQDEFGHMSFEHQELSKQIQQCTDPRLRDDLERELDSVVAKMEAKGKQIGRLRRHQEELPSKALKKSTKPRPKTAVKASMPANLNGEIEVVTTIKTRPKSASYGADSPLALPPGSAGKGYASLNLLKDLKRIQTTLRKDDITWD